MVNFCVVVGCSNRGKRDKKSFYRLPAVILREGKAVEELSRRRRHEWLRNINRADLRPESYQHLRVCSDHFISGKPSYLHDKDNPDWVPTQNMGYKIQFTSPGYINNRVPPSRQHAGTKIFKHLAAKRKIQDSIEADSKRCSETVTALAPGKVKEMSIPEKRRCIRLFSVLHDRLKAPVKVKGTL